MQKKVSSNKKKFCRPAFEGEQWKPFKDGGMQRIQGEPTLMLNMQNVIFCSKNPPALP